MGRNQSRLLRFAIQYPSWQTYGTDPATVRAVNSLAAAGFIETNGNRQFRLALADGQRAAVDGYNANPERMRATAAECIADRAAARAARAV